MYRGLLGGGAAVRGGGAVVHADDVAELIQGEAEGVREIGRQQCALRQAPYRKHSGASSCTTRTTAHAHAHTTAHAHAHTTAHALPHTHTHYRTRTRTTAHALPVNSEQAGVLQGRRQ
jgi:hypothetical protein